MFLDPCETESSGSLSEFYKNKSGDGAGVLGHSSNNSKTESKATKKRKVRVAPLRTTARKAEDAMYGLGQIQGEGQSVEENQVYVMLACLRNGETGRAEEVMWKMMEASSSSSGPRSRAIAETLESCFSALLAAQPPTDLEVMMAIVKRFTAYLGPREVPPSRCLAYILHCACEVETEGNAGRDKANKVIVEVTYDWTNNYGRKLREVLHHTDILTESDLQRIEGVCFLLIIKVGFFFANLSR